MVTRSSCQVLLSQLTRQLSPSRSRISLRRTRSLNLNRSRCSWLQHSRELLPRPSYSKCRRWRSSTSTHLIKASWKSSLRHAVSWLAISSIRRPKITSRRTWWWWEDFFSFQQWTNLCNAFVSSRRLSLTMATTWRHSTTLLRSPQ